MSAPFISFLPAIGPSLTSLYDPSLPASSQPNQPNSSSPSANTIPQIFLDAMTVRTRVFVDEQSVPLAAEFDADDPRSFHWVAYASVSASPTTESHASEEHGGHTSLSSSSQGSIPIATVRLVPPPHPPDPYTDAPVPREPFCKIGRLCTVKAYRGMGLGKMLMQAAMAWASGHADEVMGLAGAGKSETEVAVERERRRVGGVARSSDGDGDGMANGGEQGEGEWNGLVMVHAQTDVKEWYRKMGFEVDEAMGEWDEEGITHIGMLKMLDAKGREG